MKKSVFQLVQKWCGIKIMNKSDVFFLILLCNIMLFISEKNGLSFIETSALDSTNVEVAFQNILTGTCCIIY